MKAVTIYKTANGFAVIRHIGNTDTIPTVTLDNLLCFGELDDSLSYRHDGVLSAVKDFFKEPEATE